MHYQRARNGRDPAPPGVDWPLCSEEGCERFAVSRGLCNAHYVQWRYHNLGEKRNCAICGTEFRYVPSGPSYKGLYCSRTCANKGAKGKRGLRGPEHPNWRGGRHLRKRDGYVTQWVTDASGKRKLALEHRLVMAEHLGRELFDYETVHHKNGDKADNRLENLELHVGRHGRGATEAHCPTCTCFSR